MDPCFAMACLVRRGYALEPFFTEYGSFQFALNEKITHCMVVFVGHRLPVRRETALFSAMVILFFVVTISIDILFHI